MNAKGAFGAFEWATTTVNFLTGCRHACKYCYARATAARFRTCRGQSWILERVRTPPIRKRYGCRSGTVMFPSAHDLQPDHLPWIDRILESLLASGNKVLIVSKPHLQVIQHVCTRFAPFADRLLFRFSIGSTNTPRLRFWEPSAPSFRERMDCLRFAYAQGFQTSVSCEPILDDRTSDVIERTLPYVTDAVWVGKPNFLLQRLRANAEDDAKTLVAAVGLLSLLSDDYVRALYDAYQLNERVKWKDSIKKIVGVPLSAAPGMDT